MQRSVLTATALVLLLAGCGGEAATSSSPSAAAPSSAAAKPASAAASAAASAKPAASAAASASAKPAASGAAASAAAKPAASGSAAAQANPTFTDGTVQTIDAAKLTLAEGARSFNITPQTSFSKLQKETPSDVKPGQFLAITAKPQPDNTMLASFIRVQDSQGTRPANQFPMDAFANGQPVTGNTMVNAPVKSADANGAVVTLPGGDVTLKYAPNIQIMHVADGAAADVKAGSKVLIVSRGDAAANIAVYV